MELKTLISTYNKCKNSNKSTKFEREFISSLINNAYRYCDSKFIPNDVFHLANGHLNIKFTEKQQNVYNQIKERYNPDSKGEDLYHKYSKIFRDKGIILNGFDTRHLNTFKGITKESENFKKWVNGIITIKP